MNIADLHVRDDSVDDTVDDSVDGLGVRPGESDPAAMLCRVLVLLALLVPMAALALGWLLA